ncbi:MAG: class I SAM-dependent methyltransferase [Oligoflexia bacterium]|nr:class I SAM-dependent methyltransferase [Oligoflexia bacterium]
MKRIPPLQSLAISILAQTFGFGVSILVANFSGISGLLLSIVHGASAGCVAGFLRLSPTWVVVNMAMWPAAWLYKHAALPNQALLWLVLVLLLIYVPTYWTRVPFYPSSRRMYEAILEFLPQDQPFKFIDLGCGYGALVCYLAKQRPLGIFVGAELAPLPALIAWLRSRSYGSRVQITWGNFWKLPLSDYQVVYAFLAPDPMPQIEEKCAHEMKSGSTLLINSFPLSRPAQQQIDVPDERNCVLYYYRM